MEGIGVSGDGARVGFAQVGSTCRYSLVQLGAFVGCVGVTVARAWRKGPRGRDGGGDARVPRRARGRCHISVPCRAVEAMPRNRTLRQVDDSELRYDKLYLRVFPFLAIRARSSQPGAQPGDFGRLERIYDVKSRNDGAYEQTVMRCDFCSISRPVPRFGRSASEFFLSVIKVARKRPAHRRTREVRTRSRRSAPWLHNL